jgi:hypothetical protein
MFEQNTDMAPFYEQVLEEFKWKADSALLAKLKAANESELKKLEDKLTDAQTNLGETEISDALLAKADYLSKIGEKVALLLSLPTLSLSLSLSLLCLLHVTQNNHFIHPGQGTDSLQSRVRKDGPTRCKNRHGLLTNPDRVLFQRQ